MSRLPFGTLTTVQEQLQQLIQDLESQAERSDPLLAYDHMQDDTHTLDQKLTAYMELGVLSPEIATHAAGRILTHIRYTRETWARRSLADIDIPPITLSDTAYRWGVRHLDQIILELESLQVLLP